MSFWEWCIAHKIELIIAAVAFVVAVTALSICIAVAVRKRKKSGKNELFKFRRYKKFEGGANNKQQHPKLIVEVTEDEYGYMGLTESKKHGRTNNMPIKNPKKGDKRKSYIRKEVRHDKKENFYEILKEYKLSKKDKKAIIKYLENRKKK